MIPLSDPDLRHGSRPYVTWALIAINVLVFLYQVLLNDIEQFRFAYRYGAIPAELTGATELGRELFRFGRQVMPLDLTSPVPTWATMITSMFAHGGFLHLGGNMLFLWVFGDNVEDRFGRVKYLAFYLASGMAAVGAQTLMDSESTAPMIGASGAIAGVLGAYLLLFPFSRVRTLIMFGFIFVTRIPAVLLLGVWGLLQVFSSVGSLGPASSGGGVAYFAHLGGFAAGLLVAASYRVLRKEPVWPRRQRTPSWYWQSNGDDS